MGPPFNEYISQKRPIWWTVSIREAGTGTFTIFMNATWSNLHLTISKQIKSTLVHEIRHEVTTVFPLTQHHHPIWLGPFRKKGPRCRWKQLKLPMSWSLGLGGILIQKVGLFSWVTTSISTWFLFYPALISFIHNLVSNHWWPTTLLHTKQQYLSIQLQWSCEATSSQPRLWWHFQV